MYINKKSVLLSILAGLCIFGTMMISSAKNTENLRDDITRKGLEKIIKSGDNIFNFDHQAKGIKYRKVKDWDIFYDELARAHARLATEVNDETKAKSYRYIIPFYKLMIRDDIREGCQDAFPNLGYFTGNFSMESSLNLAKDAMKDIENPVLKVGILWEYYRTLNWMRFQKISNRGFENEVPIEKEAFIIALNELVADLLADERTLSQSVEVADLLSSLGKNYEIFYITRKREGNQLVSQFNAEINKAVLRYGIEIVKNEALSFNDKMKILKIVSLNLLENRKVLGLTENAELEKEFTTVVDWVWNSQGSEVGSPIEKLSADLAYVHIKECYVPEFWLQTELVPVEKQQEPKLYKVALETYRFIASESEALLEQKSLDQNDQLLAERVALESKTWIYRLMQDFQYSMESDEDDKQKEYILSLLSNAKEEMVQSRVRVEKNALQTSENATDLILHAVVNEIEYYRLFTESVDAQNKVIELVENYLPLTSLDLDGEIAEPENRLDIRYGVQMLFCEGMACFDSKNYEKAKEILEFIRDTFDDRYSMPDPWNFKIVGYAKQYSLRAKNIRKENAVTGEGE
jgi:hypothetical protein